MQIDLEENGGGPETCHEKLLSVRSPIHIYKIAPLLDANALQDFHFQVQKVEVACIHLSDGNSSCIG
jgi:hypothetical protein